MEEELPDSTDSEDLARIWMAKLEAKLEAADDAEDATPTDPADGSK